MNMTSSFESTKFRLDEATKDVPLDDIASRVVDTIAHDNKLGRETKKELFSVVRAWRNYVKEQDVKTDDLFAIRWHIDQFAAALPRSGTRGYRASFRACRFLGTAKWSALYQARPKSGG